MLTSQVQIGHTYAARLHGGPVVPVTILDSYVQRGYYRIGQSSTPSRTRWRARNEATDRIVIIRCATKLRCELVYDGLHWVKGAKTAAQEALPCPA